MKNHLLWATQRLSLTIGLALSIGIGIVTAQDTGRAVMQEDRVQRLPVLLVIIVITLVITGIFMGVAIRRGRQDPSQ